MLKFICALNIIKGYVKRSKAYHDIAGVFKGFTDIAAKPSTPFITVTAESIALDSFTRTHEAFILKGDAGRVARLLAAE